jgi:hypothetical protein
MKLHKPAVRIEDWVVVPGPNTGSFRALSPGTLLAGRVSGHPRIEEGSFIFTSPVVHVDVEHRVVETKNTAYMLGEMNPEYKTWSREHGLAA